MSDQQPVDARPDDAEGDAADAEARLAFLREQNRRLRAERRRALQATYRRSAAGLAVLGTVALAGAALFPGVRDVLLALAGIGLFAAVLVYYVSPERFIAATVGESVYDAYARTGEGIVGDLGLSDRRVYVPTDGDVRLFVPQHQAYELPDLSDVEGGFVVADGDGRRGVVVHPTGSGLHHEFEQSTDGSVAADPPVLADQLADAVVEMFELADAAEADAEPGRVTINATDCVYRPDGFDHPVASFVGVAVAATRDVPVEVEVAASDEDAVVVTATWTPDGE